MSIGITRGLTTWRFQNRYVERVMDNAAYTSAHPDDSLVLAGPARKSDAQTSAEGKHTLLAIGMLQSIQFGQTKQTQPVQAIGSGRSFFVSGKAQGQGVIQRLFVNGRNLLRVLYHNARLAGLDVSKLDDPAAENAESQYYVNLDSELYLVPFGLAAIFRSKSHQSIGGFYSELTMISNYGISFQAGGNMIAEQVQFFFDRLLPYSVATITEKTDNGLDAEDTRHLLDTVLGFQDNTTKDTVNDELSAKVQEV